MQWYISLHREIHDHWLYKEDRVFSKYEAWLDMLMMANHAPWKVVRWNQMIIVDRWSFISSELILMKKWKWWKSKLRAFLDILEKDEMILKKSDSKQTTIFLLNYDKYQIQETTKRPRADHRQTASRLPSDTNNNDNNSNNENNEEIIYIPEFSKEFQELYGSWLKDRKTRKKPVTEKAMELQLKKCRWWWEQKAISIIQEAIEKWWMWLADYQKPPQNAQWVDYEEQKRKTLERERAAMEKKNKEKEAERNQKRENEKVLLWLESLPEWRRWEIEKEILENPLITRLRPPNEDDSDDEKKRKNDMIKTARNTARILIARKYYFQDNQ